MSSKQPDSVREPAAVYDEQGCGGRMEELISSGRARRAEHDLLKLGSPSIAPHEVAISDALKELRSE